MPAGRPRKYKTPEDMQKKIDAYFEECKGTILTDKQGEPVFDKTGRPVIIGEKPPTVTGLALALDLRRQDLLNYQGKLEYQDTVTRAKQRVQAYVEGRLFDKEGARGAEFSLRCNFGWSPETASNTAGGGHDDPLTAALKEVMKQHGAKK